jgi:ATP-dependent DNA helicase DinG
VPWTEAIIRQACENMKHPLWRYPMWPERFTSFQPHQIDAIVEATLAFNDNDIVLLDAPVGSGKTVIAEAIRRLMNVKGSVYVAHTKGLMDQFLADFPYAALLKGRANYATLTGHPDITCAECNLQLVEDPWSGNKRMACDHCEPWVGCPYKVAKIQALGSRNPAGEWVDLPPPVCVTNTAYFVSEANGPAGMSNRPFVIVDECDTLESILKGIVTLEISERVQKRFKLSPPDKKTVEEAWVEWLNDEALPKFVKAHGALKLEKDKTVAQAKEFTFLTRMVDKLVVLDQLLKDGNALYDGYETGKIAFKPVSMRMSAPDMLWAHASQWLCMSGTIVDAQSFVDDLGIDLTGRPWTVVKVPMTFPVANRPIRVKSVANMTHKNKETAWPKMVAGMAEIMVKRPDDRILVHTVSYEFAKYCEERLKAEGLNRPFYQYANAGEREETLERFKLAPSGVMLAPSMDRGVDLPGDLCRVGIICKMPFLSLGDKTVQKRLYGTPGGRLWYQVQTVRSLIQMTGRNVRGPDDYGENWILDGQFTNNVWKESRYLLPDYWKEAIDWSGGMLSG